MKKTLTLCLIGLSLASCETHRKTCAAYTENKVYQKTKEEYAPQPQDLICKDSYRDVRRYIKN